jgi:hypothetical protein
VNAAKEMRRQGSRAQDKQRKPLTAAVACWKQERCHCARILAETVERLSVMPSDQITAKECGRNYIRHTHRNVALQSGATIPVAAKPAKKSKDASDATTRIDIKGDLVRKERTASGRSAQAEKYLMDSLGPF